MLGEFPNYSDAVQHIRQQLWDLLGLSLTDLSARLLESAKEPEVILRFLKSLVNLSLVLVEVVKVRGGVQLQDVDDFLEVGVRKSISYHLEIGGSPLPVVDLVQGRLNSLVVG